MNLSEIWKEKNRVKNQQLYNHKTVKAIPSEWVENTVILPNEVSRFSGRFSYDLSPYAREIIDCLHPTNPVRQVAVMKGAQSGITQGVIVPGMAWIIAEHPENFLFTASDKDIAKKTIEQRFDNIMQSSGLKHLIRPNTIRAKNQRTGDTSLSKEFAGGSAIIEGTNNVGKFRFFSVKTVFMDDFDNAPREDKREGEVKKIVEGRQTSYGNLAKTFFVSTPTETHSSNIYDAYLEGDQRKWHWRCPNCGEWVATHWKQQNKHGDIAGLVWKLDDKGRLLEETVKFNCPHCGYEMDQKDKYDLNLTGQWIPTATPEDKYFRSYYMNSLIIPPGFIDWVSLVKEWLKANPPNARPDVSKLKVFNNVRLGLPFEEKGKVPQIIKIMENTRDYKVGVIPDETCKEDGNGQIILVTLAADLGGIMEPAEDVRVDWEIMAHASTGATYAIDQGSIGTFKRTRAKTQKDKRLDGERMRYTYRHDMKNSVWPILEDIIKKQYPSESGASYNISLSLVDTGHFTKYAREFTVRAHKAPHWVFGIKGQAELNYRNINKDQSMIRKSSNDERLYLLDTEQLKDMVASNMDLKVSDEHTQQGGFMNFPQPYGLKYQLATYFKHFESEARKEVIKNGNVVGFKWDKKNSSVENHFWDVCVYNNAARYIYVDLIKRTSPTKFKALDWATLASIIEGK